MKTAELTGAMLDYWVAKAQRPIGVEIFIRTTKEIPQCMLRGGSEDVWFCPSINWTQGGPIIERERIATFWDDQKEHERGYWFANYEFPSDTLLVAAMRAYVASKFGEEVPDNLEVA